MGLRLVLLGPPGSGKGTMAQLLEERLALRHVSTGELFRREIQRDTALGKAVKQYVSEGRLVPDDVVVKVMTGQLSNRLLGQGVVLDGFPRTVGQARGFDRFLTQHRRPLHAALSLACPTSVLVSRLAGRLVCSRCGTNYHRRTMRPKRRGVCDRCQGTLIARKDDQVSTVKQRLAIDRAKAKPLLAYYRHKRMLYRLDGSGSSLQVFGRVVRLLKRRGWLASSDTVNDAHA